MDVFLGEIHHPALFLAELHPSKARSLSPNWYGISTIGSVENCMRIVPSCSRGSKAARSGNLLSDWYRGFQDQLVIAAERSGLLRQR